MKKGNLITGVKPMKNIKKIRDAWKEYKDCRIYAGPMLDSKDVVSKNKCHKNELWVGIKRFSKTILHIVKKDEEYIHKLDKDFDDLTIDELKTLGLLPGNQHICELCGEFSVRIIKIKGKYTCIDCEGILNGD